MISDIELDQPCLITSTNVYNYTKSSPSISPLMWLENVHKILMNDTYIRMGKIESDQYKYGTVASL